MPPMFAVARTAPAACTDELSVVAVSAPVAPAAAIIAALPDALGTTPLVSWSANDLTLVGIGSARELRGHGAARWREVIEQARSTLVNVGTCTVDGQPCTLADLGFGPGGFARPRFIGGAAFAPGTADRAPWLGFGDAWFVLPRWTYVSDGARAMLVLAADAHEVADAARWQPELARMRTVLAIAATAGSRARSQPALVELQPAPAEQWRAQVTAIGEAIRSGEYSKIVAARTCGVALAGDIDIASLLGALESRHRDFARVLIRPSGAHPAGTLVAATPERLVRLDGRIAQCDALAGTINRGQDPDGASAMLRASTKDRREHELVVSAIRAALEDAGAVVESTGEPQVRSLRHVLHLHTPFRATLAEPRHVLELVARLHPTPAVGGTPTTAAIDWIASHEPVARGWYASPVGWFDFDGNGELAVAIRSGVITDNRAHLWSGAGIVAGSDPDRELAETEAKFRAMLGALGVAR